MKPDKVEFRFRRSGQIWVANILEFLLLAAQGILDFNHMIWLISYIHTDSYKNKIHDMKNKCDFDAFNIFAQWFYFIFKWGYDSTTDQHVFDGNWFHLFHWNSFDLSANLHCIVLWNLANWRKTKITIRIRENEWHPSVRKILNISYIPKPVL